MNLRRMFRRRPKDPDQQAVYHAEQVTFEDSVFIDSMNSDDFMRLAERLFTHDWWERHNIPVPTIEPAGAKDKNSHAWIRLDNVADNPVIRLLPVDITPRILAHETAHIAQYHFYRPNSYGPIEVHGREFRATYLSVAEIVLGREAAAALQANFDKFVNHRPEHAFGMPGSIMCVPRSRPENDPPGIGLFLSSVPHLNGAIAL